MLTIYTLTAVKGSLLLIFKDGHGYQFRVISQSLEVFGKTEIFYTLEAAERAAAEWISDTINN